MIQEIIDALMSKAKTEFILNLVIFADFSRWPQLKLKEFIDCIDEMTYEEHEMNRIVFSYNPILTICLACIHLLNIGKSISLFRYRGNTISSQLQDLGV